MEFVRGSGSGSEADSHDRPGLTVDQIWEMITIEVSNIVQEELFGVVDRITGRLIAKFEERTAAFQTTMSIVEMTVVGDFVEATRLGKRRRAFLAKGEETEAANLGTGSQ